MKKTLAFCAFVAIMGAAMAQYITRTSYLPREGERQVGVVLGPSIGGHDFGVTQLVSSGMPALPFTSKMHQGLGVQLGAFYGYETDHSRFLDFGMYGTLVYGVHPFRGSVTVTDPLLGVKEYDVKVNTKSLSLHVNPFLSYRIKEHWVANLGVGATVAAGIAGEMRMEGFEVVKPGANVLDLSNAFFDVNLGGKYYFNDFFYVGARLSWVFYSLSKLADDLLGEGENAEDYIGYVSADFTEKIATYTFKHQPNKVQLLVYCGVRF